jgi:hypothetical protein
MRAMVVEGSDVGRGGHRPGPGEIKAVRAVTLVTVLVCLLYVAVALWAEGGDPMRFVLVGSRYASGDPAGEWGYDGQFSYQIARDPLGGYRYVDDPAYRYQRVLYPLLARWVALGRQEWIPYTLILVNLAAIGACAYLAGRLLAHHGVSAWYALPCGLYAGLLIALRLDTNEPVSYALVLLALWFDARGPGWASGLALAFATFAKETAVLAAGAFLLSYALERRWRGAGQLLLLWGLPFVAYRFLLYHAFGSFGLASGGAGKTSFSLLPFGGLLDIGRDSVGALLVWLVILGPLVVVPSVVAVVLAGRSIRRHHWHPLVFVLLANALLMIVLPRSTYREISGTTRLSIGLVHAMVLYGGLRRSPRVLNYGLLWLFSLVLLERFVCM